MISCVTCSLDELIEQTTKDDIHILPVKNAHLAAYDRIPLFDQHRDPFDRLILATALAENWPVISADEKFRLYDGVVQLIW
nr:PIN domain-containing protein [uncultured Arsenicibacter sp.]